ncbi:MAG: hypothetical protein ABJP34_04570 [Erythrobacter sp.]
MRGLVALTVSAALLAGCSSGQRKPSPRALKQIDRALERAPGKAQPSIIVKTELALNRVARDSGQVDAYRQFAAPNAKIHTEGGVQEAADLFSRFGNPNQTSKFDTKSVWMSCDGSVAVSQGRGTDPDGKVGTYIFVWERQAGIRPDGDEETGYRYIYFAAAADDPQPAPRPPEPAPKPGDIVVEALDAVKADIARCVKKGDPLVMPVLSTHVTGTVFGGGPSSDGTLNYGWAHKPNGSRGFDAWLLRKDDRQNVLTWNVAADGSSTLTVP